MNIGTVDYKTASKNEVVKGHLAMLVANVAWGLMSPVSKEILNSGLVSSMTLSGIRIMGGAALFWLVSFLLPSNILPKEKIQKCDWWKVALAGLLIVSFNQAFYIVGIGYTSPVDSTVVCSMTPIMTMILAAFVLGERITLLKALGVIIGFAGAMAFVFTGKVDVSKHITNPVLGDTLCLIAQVCAAVYYVAFKDIITKYSPYTLMKWMFLVAALSMVPLTLYDIVSLDWANMPSFFFGDIAYIIVFPTFVSYLMIPYSQKRLRPTVVSIYNYSQPVIAAIYSAVVGLAVMSGVQVCSALTIFLGVWIVTQSKTKNSNIGE